MDKNKIFKVVKKFFPNIKSMPSDFTMTLDRMLGEDAHGIDRERLNIILSAWRLPPAGESFFKYYFGENIQNTETLEDGIRRFLIDALWHFGEIDRGYNVLGKYEDLDSYVSEHQFDLEEFRMRLPWNMVDDIAPMDRGFLGYVSGQRPLKEQKMLTTTEKILKELADNSQLFREKTSEEIRDAISAKLTKENLEHLAEFEQEDKVDLFNVQEVNKNVNLIKQRQSEVEETIEKVKKLKEKGTKNQVQYLRNIEMIDVYVATSMRDDKEYIEMADFVQTVFDDENVCSLNLRYFDPTLCFCESRIDKGIIECLLVRTAKLTIYCAQDGDTFGKDSELAATLCQGKPVIVYVPKGDGEDPERNKKLNARAKVFQDFHPLGLQVGLYDGVARGVIVVRTPEMCAKILHQILTNSLEVKLCYEQHGLALREISTNSVVRAMTGWGELAHSFWNNFGISNNSKSGRPE